MHVKLISYTQPVFDLEQEGIKTPIDLVAYCARVSNPANQHNVDTSEKLLKYLIKHKHWSPLEMIDITVEIETTRAIGRQILRHRSFSFQEFSQRYAIADLGFEHHEARLQDAKNRQNSLDTDDEYLKTEWNNRQIQVMNIARANYAWAIEMGIAKEQARDVLPEGMTLSRFYMKGSLRSWIHYIQLRTSEGTQKEHREVAKEAQKIIASVIPNIFDITKE